MSEPTKGETTNQRNDEKVDGDRAPLPGATDVQQLRFRVKPTSRHRTSEEWETAGVALLIKDEDRSRALSRAKAELRKRNFEILEELRHATLVEQMVLDVGEEAWEAYLRAIAGEVVFIHVPETRRLGTPPKSPLFAPATLTEEHFDEVLSLAGGQRVTDVFPDQTGKNADYLLGDVIFELKALEEDGLRKGERQAKLASLFGRYSDDGSHVAIDSSLLSDEDRREYRNILGSPIQTHVKKAAKQIKATKIALNRPELRGGLIALNTGFPSLGADDFANEVLRYATKDTSELTDIVAISVWAESNGHDMIVHYSFHPHGDSTPEIKALRHAFSVWFEKLMTDLMRGKQSAEAKVMSPGLPTVFTLGGVTFRWEPPSVPSSIFPERQKPER